MFSYLNSLTFPTLLNHEDFTVTIKDGKQIIFLIPIYLAAEAVHLACREKGGFEIVLKSTTMLEGSFIREHDGVGEVLSNYISLGWPPSVLI